MPSGGARASDPFFEEYPLALIERLATVQATLGRPWTLEGLYPAAVLRFHLEAPPRPPTCTTSAYQRPRGAWPSSSSSTSTRARRIWWPMPSLTIWKSRATTLPR